MPSSFVRSSILASLALALLPTGPVRAQDDEDPARSRWVLKGELTSVLSQGNSDSFTAGLGAVVRRIWERDRLRFEVSGIRTEASKTTRRAIGTETDFDVDVSSNREKTAEAYGAKARYDRTLTDRFFAFGSVDWLRNTFAGIDSRTLLAVGAGNTWMDRDRVRFKTSYAVTYTIQRDVVARADAKENFLGAQAGWEYWNKLSASTEFESVLVADFNLDQTDDVRIDTTNSLVVNMSDRLALKPSLQLLWRNLPSLTDVPLFTAGGVDTGEVVQVPLDKLDTFFRLALVLTL